MVIIALLVALSTAYNCSQITGPNLLAWDLSPLFTTYRNLTIAVVNHEDISIDTYSLIFDLCKPVGLAVALDPADTCGEKAWACRLLNNYKKGAPRILSAKLYGASEPIVDPASTANNLILKMNGGDNNFTINFECTRDQTNLSPVLENYIPARIGLPGISTHGGEVVVRWKTSNACAILLGSGAIARGSFGYSLWTFLFGGLMLYFSVGIAMNYYQRKGNKFLSKKLCSLMKLFGLG